MAPKTTLFPHSFDQLPFENSVSRRWSHQASLS